ncbi:hypothetical protein H9636_08995 [Ureibacillus sp. Re31]|uniref:Uncharacterized protein n=1 Tax=Ureibacillus galli TaxID=2762222 RepID=A0ABR8XC53_9BACL|nr:hypothetical protein [Ureibacillus galli]MBD8026795.1 hypothetical protein [Ureibacillus galli]
MSTKVPMTNNHTLNLVELNDRMEEIVFNYIDTTQNWKKAYTNLDELVKSAVNHFNHVVQANGELPKENTYWVLYMNVVCKLLYFHTISNYHLQMNIDQDVKKEVLNLLTVAANCIPDVHMEDNAEFLKELATSYENIELYNGKQGEFEKMIVAQNNRVIDCIKTFSTYSINQ